MTKKTKRLKVDHFIEDAGASGMDFETLKTGGIIKQRQKGKFTVRLMCPGGRVPLSRLAQIVEAARKYGGDYVHLSFRQSIEIPYVDFSDLEALRAELQAAGQPIASCGPRVRVPTACSGCEYNPNGLLDTQKTAAEVSARFFGKQPLAHKFKISFSGCPIDCARTSEMDLGFQAAVQPRWSPETCTGCRVCAYACAEGAIESDPHTGEPIYHPEKCLFCGDCIRACPTESWQEEKRGWVIRVGGKHGRHPLTGSRIADFLPEDKVSTLITAVLEWYQTATAGQDRRRIGALLLEKKHWESFWQAIRPVLDGFAVKQPVPPRQNEIHFPASEEELSASAGPVDAAGNDDHNRSRLPLPDVRSK